MSSESNHRRYLIAVGITTDLPKTGSKIVDSVNEMTRIFTTEFGYERASSLDIDPGREEIGKQIREFCLGRDQDDVVVLYYTAHASEVNGKHRVWAGDTRDSVSGTLETQHLAELMLVGTRLRYALIILDTCDAGRGAAEALHTSMQSAGEGDKTLALLAASYPREQIVAGSFARLFARAVAQPAVAGHEPPYLTLGAITRIMDADPSRPGWQTVSDSVLFGRTDNLPFFPNKRYNRELHGLDLLTQLRIEQQNLRAADMAGHFLPRARGVDVPSEPGWRFVGRAVALRDIVRWLRARNSDPSYRVVTGGPGSGKSALIGRLVVLSDDERRPAVPLQGLAEDTIPPDGAIAAGIHARGLTTAQVMSAICAAVGVAAATPVDMLRQMRQADVTVAIDAIDEALDPAGLVSGVLRPLLDAGPANGLRLLLGTRPHLLKPLGVTGHVIDLDDDRYADPVSLREYVERGLEADDPQSPYHTVHANVVAAVAAAVAHAAGCSFLVARIVSRTLLSTTPIPDPDDPGWRASLPATAAEAMHADLDFRLGPDADRARDLLRPLAFAHGAGLPWEDIWAKLAARLSGRSYTDDDLIWLRRQAGSYVVETMDSEQSVYRLYHAALAEYLRHGCDDGVIHDQFREFLISRVPASGTVLDWKRAHPDTRAHLATHAQEAGRLDELLLDPGYLIYAAPAALLAALPAAAEPDAERAAEAYQRAVHQLRDRPEDDRFSYLELASRITHAAELAKRIDARAPRRRWSVPWTHWPPEHPHRVLGGQLGPVNGVACGVLGNGRTIVACIGQDAKLRFWDLETAEPSGSYPVGTAPLIALRFFHLPGGRNALVILGEDGKLHFWDMLTASVTSAFSTVSRWRRLLGLRVAAPSLRPLRIDGHDRYMVVSGRGIRTSLWDVSENRRITLFPSYVVPDSVSLADLVDGTTVIVARAGGSESWVGDLRTGARLPDDRQRIAFSGLRAVTDVFLRTNPRYFALQDGRPVVAARFFRRAREVVLWDLTVPGPLGRWPAPGPPVRVTLTNGQVVRVPVQTRQTRSGGPVDVVSLAPGDTAPDQSHMSATAIIESSERFVQVEFTDYLAAAPSRTIRLTLAGHTADVTGFDWTRLPDRRLIVVTGSRDGTVRRWDVSSVRATVSGAEGVNVQPAVARVYTVPLEDGRLLGLTVDFSAEILMWDLRTGRRLGGLAGQERPPCAVCIAPYTKDRPAVVTFDTDAMARTWTLPDGRPSGQFRTDPIRWPGAAAAARLPDGTWAAVTAGHGRKTVIWDVSTGRMRDVLGGHTGWSSCVTCTQDSRARPLALTGGYDNRINVWDMRSGRRTGRFRIVSERIFLASRISGHATSLRCATLRDGQSIVFAATADGNVRALQPRRFGWGARRVAAIPGVTVVTGTLGNGRPVALTARPDGVVQIWAVDDIARGSPPLCEIDVEIAVNDISEINDDMFAVATPNGLTAIRLDSRALGLAGQ
jgi:WD40 repeat protein